MTQINVFKFLKPRYFAIAFVEGNGCFSTIKKIDDFFNDDEEHEYIFSIRENMDEIIKLETGQSLQMSFNRDDVTGSCGFIKRIEAEK